MPQFRIPNSAFRIALVAGLLVQADQVSRRIPESRRDLGCVRADRLDQRASLSGDDIDGRRHAVDHDIDQQAFQPNTLA